MFKDLFDPANFQNIANGSIPEIHINKPKKRQMLFIDPEANCSHWFETLEGIFLKIENENEINEFNIFDDLPECNTKLRTTNLLGEYYPDKREILYYPQTPEELQITEIHEKFHAIHHLTFDRNGNIWERFSKTPDFFLELLAQLFTWIYVKDNNYLRDLFLQLNSRQPFYYQTYKIFKHYDHTRAEQLYWIIRNENMNNPFYPALHRIQSRINNKIMKPTINKCNFSRSVSGSLLSDLSDHPLYQHHLLKDIKMGSVFPIIREKDQVDFYYKGGKLFQFDNKGFHTHIKYASVIDKTSSKNYLTEKELSLYHLITDFTVGYERIKENCSMYSDIEASGVSKIYHKYSYVNSLSDIFVIDLEIALRTTGGTWDKIDFLIYNKKNQQLRFVEAKHFSNPELWSTNPQKNVEKQINRYENKIRSCDTEIIDAYQKYIAVVNRLFNINLPDPKDIDKKVTLLIFGYDRDQEKGRLKNKLIPKMKSACIKNYNIGNIEKIDLVTVWNRTL